MPDQRLTTLEKNYSLMDQKLDQISADIKELKVCAITEDKMEIANRHLVEEVFEKAERKYAHKTRVELIEKVVFGAVGAGLLYLINNLLEII